MVQMNKKWIEECQKRAKWIRDGGLVLPSEDGVLFSQVDERGHELLAQINQLGFITADSQEGQGTKRTLVRERAYVHGWLPKASLERFLTAVNQASGVVAWAVSPVGSYPSEANVTSLPVTLARSGKVETRVPMLGTAEEIAEQAKLAKLGRFKGSIAMVDVVDAQWGRLAFQPGGLFMVVRDALRSL